ncbi:MAG: acyl-CoA carboxylase epsilon subunit [Actinomycetes bacterium]
MSGGDTGSTPDPRTPSTPLLHVVGGRPSAAELAAVVAVLAVQGAKASGATAGNHELRRSPVSGWSDHRRRLRVGLTTSSDGWRRSAWPL